MAQGTLSHLRGLPEGRRCGPRAMHPLILSRLLSVPPWIRAARPTCRGAHNVSTAVSAVRSETIQIPGNGE